MLSHTAEQWDFHTGRQANSQTNIHMYTTCPPKRFLSSFLSRLNKQTRLSRSFYSCVGFCVSVCFNLNGFQVPSLPESVSPFSPLIQQLTLKLSSSPPALSLPLFFSLSLSPHHFLSPHITVCHPSLSPLQSCFSLCSHFPPPLSSTWEKHKSEICIL